MSKWYKRGGNDYRDAMSELKAYGYQMEIGNYDVNVDAYFSALNTVELCNKLFNNFRP